MRSSMPLGRLGQADDVADAALAIARDLRHMHGAVVTSMAGRAWRRSWQLGLGLARKTEHKSGQVRVADHLPDKSLSNDRC
jgi:hypothetical protein